MDEVDGEIESYSRDEEKWRTKRKIEFHKGIVTERIRLSKLMELPYRSNIKRFLVTPNWLPDVLPINGNDTAMNTRRSEGRCGLMRLSLIHI